jgi:hypothetical protein
VWTEDPFTQNAFGTASLNLLNGTGSISEESRLSLFTAYLDDSGNHDGAKSLVIAGFLGLTIDWVNFEILWANLLNRYALTHVRGTKLASFRGEFETWNAKKRHRFVEDMVQTLNVAGLLGIAATLDERVFKEVFPQATIALADKAFGLLFRLLALKMCSRVSCGDGEISFVLEDGSRDDSDAKRVFESLKTRKSDPLARKLGTFAVASKKAFGALQAADFLAYNAYRNMDAIRSGAVVHETFGQLLRLGYPQLMVVELNRELLEGWRDQAATRLLQLAGA